MNKLALLFLFFKMMTINAQIVTDTIFSGKAVPLYRFCKSKQINEGLAEKCIGEKIKLDNFSEFYHPRHLALSNLDGLNERSKSNIFTSYTMLLISYYCMDIDFIQNVFLYEMHMQNEDDAKKLINTLNKLYKDKNFWEHIGTKNWYFVRNNTIVYFIFTRSNDEISPMKIILENKIKEVLKI